MEAIKKMKPLILIYHQEQADILEKGFVWNVGREKEEDKKEVVDEGGEENGRERGRDIRVERMGEGVLIRSMLGPFPRE